MTGFGRDAFSEAEHQAALGWETTLVTPDGLTWLLRPGGPWLRWSGPAGWLTCPPPADPGFRRGAHRVPTNTGAPQPTRPGGPPPGYPQQPHVPGYPAAETPAPGLSQPHMSGYPAAETPAPGLARQLGVPHVPGYPAGSPSPLPGAPQHAVPHVPGYPAAPAGTPGPGFPAQPPAPAFGYPAAPSMPSMPPVPAAPQYPVPGAGGPPPGHGYPAAPPSGPVPPPPPPSGPGPGPVVELLELGTAMKSFVGTGASARGFIDQIVRVVRWSADARHNPNRDNQPNPIILLVGEPHSGQGMLAESLKHCLAAAGAIPHGAWDADNGRRIFQAVADNLVGQKLIAEFDDTCVRHKKVYFVREADALLGSAEAADSVWPALSDIAGNQDSESVLILLGTEKFLDALQRGAPGAISSSSIYHLPSFRDPQVRAAVLDTLAAERGVLLTPPARSRLLAYAGECILAGSMVGGEAVISSLEGATRAAVGRGSLLYDGRVQVDLPDLGAMATPRGDASEPARDRTALLAELDAMIGLEPVKRQVRALLDEVAVDEQRRAGGLRVSARSRHLVFTGNPGTAKTTVARLLAQIYRAIGLLSTGHVVEAQSADLIAEFVGKTAPKTRRLCEKAMGGVLFIDEAYELTPRGDNDFGGEAIAELLVQMENHRDDLIVIAAGYPKQMDEFLDANPGLRSRFAGRVEFPDYSDDELAGIFELMAGHEGYRLAPALSAALPARMSRIGRGAGFANGRSARALLEATLSAQSTRLAGLAGAGQAALTELLPADLPEPGAGGVGPSGDGGPRRGLAELMSELEGMVGLSAVKEQVRSISAEIRVDARRRAAGLKVSARSRHLVFTGNPGTAKTTVARLLAQIYRELGVLTSGHLIEVSRPDLVGEHVGETGPKTRKVCEKALGGVLFVDEAYELTPRGDNDFGGEAIAELLVQMENHRDDLIVIAAGYPADMERLLDADPGLRSRFGGSITFPDYTDQELVRILTAMIDAQGYKTSPGLFNALPGVVAGIDRGRGFANGRSVRGLLDRMVERQSTRLAGPGSDIDALPDEALTLLTPADLPLEHQWPTAADRSGRS